MVKKSVKKSSAKKTTKKKAAPKKKHSTPKRDVENILIENFVSLQKVMTNLSIKFDALSKNITDLLDVFESSAKTLAQKEIAKNKEEKVSPEMKEMMEKIDNLLDQNKIIARGLLFIHEKNESMENMMPPAPEMPRAPPMQPPAPMPPTPMAAPPKPAMPKPIAPPQADNYQKSIFTKED